jgi:hypothetical protein
MGDFMGWRWEAAIYVFQLPDVSVGIGNFDDLYAKENKGSGMNAISDSLSQLKRSWSRAS